MGISALQQLEAFAYWRRQILAAPGGQELWGLPEVVEAKLMNQAPLYALSGQKLDFYVEIPLCGQPQVDLSAQYFAEGFANANPLRGSALAQEGDFFHYYAKELLRLKPQLLRYCNLYLEADIDGSDQLVDENAKVASFINLSGDFVEELLLAVLAYRGRLQQATRVNELLDSLKDYCEPWHFGFMESREERQLRLVLILKQGLANLEEIIQAIGAPSIPQEGLELLRKIDALGIFKYMLDVDVLRDGSLGNMVGIELIPQNAVFPATQQALVQTDAYAQLCELLQQAGLADARIQNLSKTIMATPVDTCVDTYIYSRISHFKLRWQGGEPLPAKVYCQMRPVRKQQCLNEALGYVKLFLSEGDQ